MGSIPVRSTKKHRMQNCIRCFLVLFLVNSSSVRQYGKAVFLPRVSCLRETANSRIYQQQQSLQFCIRCFLVLLLANPSSVRQYGKAVFLPRVSRLRETANSRIYQQKQSLQNCIRCFLVLFLVNPSSVRQYGIAVFLPRVSRLRETLNLFPWSSVFSYAKRSLYSRCGHIKARYYAFFFLIRAK